MKPCCKQIVSLMPETDGNTRSVLVILWRTCTGTTRKQNRFMNSLVVSNTVVPNVFPAATSITPNTTTCPCTMCTRELWIVSNVSELQSTPPKSVEKTQGVESRSTMWCTRGYGVGLHNRQNLAFRTSKNPTLQGLREHVSQDQTSSLGEKKRNPARRLLAKMMLNSFWESVKWNQSHPPPNSNSIIM